MADRLPAVVTGKILWVDLTLGSCTEERVPPAVYERFLGGPGLAAWLLYQRIPAGADALGPHNVLAFTSGLLTGSGALMSGRWSVCAKSPLTGTWGESNCGGNFAPAIKSAGYDGIFFSGVSSRPCYLYLCDGKVELRDADELWGLDTLETEARIRAELGRQTAVACIGSAGERLSLLAGIANDGGRMAARSGLGAVMGAKRLKAVAVGGASTGVVAADGMAIAQLNKACQRWIQMRLPFFSGPTFAWVGRGLLGWLPLALRMDGMLYRTVLRKWGTSGMNQAGIEMGDGPLRNWLGTPADYPLSASRSIDPDRMRARETDKYACAECPLACGGHCRMKDGRRSHKPEYETTLAFSGMLLNQDLDSIYTINDLLNRAGMDSISAGAAVAFAIDCYQQGLLRREDTGGLELDWGNSAAILTLVQWMIAREGIGALLADGTLIAAGKIGGTALEVAMQAGGQELPMHDGRGDPGYALHYAVEPVPGRHMYGSYLFYEMFQLWTRVKNLPRPWPLIYVKQRRYLPDREKAAWAAACSQFTQLLNGAGVCTFAAFLGVHRFPFFEYLNAATGWDKSPDEIMRIGWNIQTLRQAFNLRQGVALRHAVNPRALGEPALTSGVNKGRRARLDVLIPLYYERMGWDMESGEPPMDEVEHMLTGLDTQA